MEYKQFIKELEQNICFNKQASIPVKYLKSEMYSIIQYCDLLNQKQEEHKSRISIFNPLETIMIVGWHFLKDKITDEESGMASHAFNNDYIKKYVELKTIEFDSIKQSIIDKDFSNTNKNNIHLYYYIIENSNLDNKSELLNTCLLNFINTTSTKNSDSNIIQEQLLLPNSFLQEQINFNYSINNKDNMVAIKNNKLEFIVFIDSLKNDSMKIVLSLLKYFEDTELQISNNNLMLLLQTAHQQNLNIKGNMIESTFNTDNIFIGGSIPHRSKDSILQLAEQLKEIQIQPNQHNYERQSFNPNIQPHFQRENRLSMKHNLKK